jgi:hypothetical protein
MALKPSATTKPVAKPASKKPVAAAPAQSKAVQAMAAARAAKATGKPAVKKTTAATPATTRVQAPKAIAPADFKPFFLEVKFEVSGDGLLDPSKFNAFRVKGRWDNPDNRRYDLREYDVDSLLGIAARISSATYAPNFERRLPAGSQWILIFRVAKSSVDGTLRAALKVITVKLAGKRSRLLGEDKTDLLYRKIRKVNRIAGSAFVNVQLPPAGRRPKQAAEEDAD